MAWLNTLFSPSGETTHGTAYVGNLFQASIGTQLALNNASVPGTHAAVLGLVDFFCDSLFPCWGNSTIE
jgi:hypothetical protein